MKTMAGGLLFWGVFSLVLSFTMVGDAAIIGAIVSGVAILCSVGFWFGATEVARTRTEVNEIKKTSFPSA